MQDNGLTQQILSRLDAIGAKLGVAAQAVWGFYLRQAKVEGLESLITGIIALLLLAVGIRFWQKVWDWDYGTPRENGYGRENEHSEGPIICAYFCLLVALFIFGVIQVYSSFTPLMNPGYWAFQQLLSQMK